MYIPPSFRIDDAGKLSAFMNAHSFATLVTCNEGVPFATQLPVRHYCDNGACTTLVSHMARANPQWKHFTEDTEVLTIFSGPHAYISPSWYAADPAVPTWNYTTTHVYGHVSIMSDHAQVVSMLDDTVRFYESSMPNPWPGVLPEEFMDMMVKSIVAFEIKVTRVEGKFKLNQNRSPEDRQGVYNALSTSMDGGDRDLAEAMANEGLVNGKLLTDGS